MQYANRVLNEYKGNQSAWMTVDKILELCQDNNAKFFALQILDEAINVSKTFLQLVYMIKERLTNFYLSDDSPDGT